MMSWLQTRYAGGATVLAVVIFMLAACSQPNDRATQWMDQPFYVSLQGSHAVQKLPSMERLDGLHSAHYVATNNAQSQLLVSSAQQPTVFLVDAGSGVMTASFDVGEFPQGVGISPDGKWGLAVGAKAGTVTLIDMEKGEQRALIAVGNDPHNVLFTADSSQAYVTLQGEGAIAIVDVASRGMVDKFLLEGVAYPHNLALSDDGNMLWIRAFDSKVAAVDLASRTVKAVIPVGASHAGIAVVPDSRWVATGAIGGTGVAIIDADTFEVVRTVEVGQGSHGIRASADGRYLYTGVTTANQIAVIDTHTWQVIKRVDVEGKTPFWLSLSSNN